MKRFKDYLMEGKRQYKYTVKLAFKPSDEMMDKIEGALGRFDLDSISKAKSLPIKRIDTDFPTLSSPEVYTINVVLNYPATADFVRHTIAQIGMETENVAVLSTDHMISVEKEEDHKDKSEKDKPLLQQPFKNDSNKEITDANYGDNYNEKLVKNSLTKLVDVPNAPAKAETSNDLPQGKLSPVGTKQNKIPKVKSFRR
jgi:hypothetical protein